MEACQKNIDQFGLLEVWHIVLENYHLNKIRTTCGAMSEVKLSMLLETTDTYKKHTCVYFSIN